MDDRAEAIDILTRMSTNHFYGHREQEAFKLAVEALKQRWIPVTERLPEESGEYLVVLDSLIYFSWFYKEDGVWSFKNADITAWMQLPEPYKGGEEE